MLQLLQARGLTVHARASGGGSCACAASPAPLRRKVAAAAAAAAQVQPPSAAPGHAHGSSGGSLAASPSPHRHWQQRQGWRFCGSVAAAAAADGAGALQEQQQQDEQQQQQQQQWSVLNFYHLVDIADPEEMLARHKAFIAANGLDTICGRIYISKQGINCQGGGTQEHAQEYVEWVGQQPEFAGLFHTLWPAPGPMFPRLRLKLKPNLISLAGGMESVTGVTDPAARATPLGPAEWRARMAAAAAANAAVAAGRADQSKRVVVMDLRNDYEWDAGHFEWAPRPDEEVFAETPVPAAQAATEAAAAADAAAAAESSEDDDDDEENVPGDGLEVPSPLKDADPENTEVLMYCTGGIRCDVYSALLRQKGFKKLYTLHGGIQHYLREEGSEHWRGSLFVFDGRMAINPALQRDGSEDAPLPAAVPCQLCGAAEASLPHLNCANMDCNELFIACPACKAKYHGCCCEACQAAPRLLRPIKIDGGNYGSWNQYADPDALAPLISTKRNHEGRVARRARRRATMRAKREAAMAGRRELRAAMKAAMKAAEAAAQEEEEEKAAGVGQQRQLQSR